MYIIHRHEHRKATKVRKQQKRHITNEKKKKEQEKTPEKELKEMETSNPPDTQFKTQVIRMLNERRRRIDALSENSNKEIVSIKRTWKL